MLDIIQQIAVSTVTTVIVLPLFLIFGKKFVERYVDHIFKRVEQRRDTQEKSRLHAENKFFEQELTVYPEIAQVIYQCRNTARDCAEPGGRSRKALRAFSMNRNHLVENLFKYRVLLTEETFKELHAFKHAVQDYGVLLDQATRPDAVPDAALDPALKPMVEDQIRRNCARIVGAGDKLLADIAAHLNRKRVEFGS